MKAALLQLIMSLENGRSDAINLHANAALYGIIYDLLGMFNYSASEELASEILNEFSGCFLLHLMSAYVLKM
jgi:hypothetical protein